METPIVEHSSRQGAPAPRQAAGAPPGLFDLILRDRTEGASSEAPVARPAEDGGAPAVQRPDRGTSGGTTEGAEQQPKDPALAPGTEAGAAASPNQTLATPNAPGAVAAVEAPSTVQAAQAATPQSGPQDGKAQALSGVSTGAAEGARGEAQAPLAAQTKAAAQAGAAQSAAEKAAPGSEAAGPRANATPDEQAAKLAAARNPVTATQAASAMAATAQTAQAAASTSATQGPQAPGKPGAKSATGQPVAASAGASAAATANLPGNSAPVAETQLSLAVDPISGMTAGSLDGDAQAANTIRLSGPASLAAPQGADFAGLARAAGEARGTAEQQVAIQIRRAVSLGSDRINIRLSPAELGQVQVRLEVAEDGHVRALISAERAETLDLMQRDPRGLERALQDAGLKTDGDSLSFSLQDGGDGQSEGPGDDTASSPAAREDGPASEAPSLDTQILRWSAGDGRLDIQV